MPCPKEEELRDVDRVVRELPVASAYYRVGDQVKDVSAMVSRKLAINDWNIFSFSDIIGREIVTQFAVVVPKSFLISYSLKEIIKALA